MEWTQQSDVVWAPRRSASVWRWMADWAMAHGDFDLAAEWQEQGLLAEAQRADDALADDAASPVPNRGGAL